MENLNNITEIIIKILPIAILILMIEVNILIIYSIKDIKDTEKKLENFKKNIKKY